MTVRSRVQNLDSELNDYFYTGRKDKGRRVGN